MKQTYLLLLLLTAALQYSCRQHPYENPGPSLIYLPFNGTVENTGMMKVSFQGDSFVSFAKGVADSCLDLSGSARYRKPLVIVKGSQNRFTDYDGFSFMTWVKMMPDDYNEYTIAAQRIQPAEGVARGWQLTNSVCGSWRWELTDGNTLLEYKPTARRQPLNDGRWHQIGFSIDYKRSEARFFYDGLNRAVYSLEGMDLAGVGAPLFLGADPLASDAKMETFNGMMDEVSVWSRALTDNQVAGLYRQVTGKRLKAPAKQRDSLTIMTWNIWHGGRHEGRHVGVERVAEIIRDSGADIVSLQETYGSGEMIADALGFYFYSRSSNLSVLSRFPLGKSYNSFRPFNFGAVRVHLDETNDLMMCPLWLSYLPNTGAYVMGGNAVADTIEVREMETRGTEIRFILSEIQPFIRNSDRVPVVLAGDFNSGSHLDWTESNKELYYGLVVNYPVSNALLQKGFADSYRTLFPDETTHPGQTWSPIFNETMQDRIDYIYYMGLVPVSSRVINSHPLGFPSDHAAVVSVFKR